MLSAKACYRALGARDPRFDGLFFVGVTTTGVYCRPICPARTPRADRCRFFSNAAAAEKAGFRACLRCRPELAPGSAPVDARPSLVARALARIDAGYLDEHSVEQLASELAVSSRHLRRALEAELGVGPLELAATRRLALAKQLLHDSDLDLTTIAFASGFTSVRRFNAAFAARFERPPSSLRRELGTRGVIRDGRPINLRLDLRPPFCWPALLEFLRKRAIAGIEHVDDRSYRRLVALDGRIGELSVVHDPTRPCLRVELPAALALVLASIVTRLRRLFDLDAQPAAIDPLLASDPLLAPLVAKRPGLRVPGCFDRFEALVRTILGQQVSLAAARTLTGRLVEQFGQRLDHESAHGLDRLFPSPATLASASIETIASIGIPRARATVIRTLASAWTEGTLDSNDAELALARLGELPGVGVWTRDYAALRVLHVPDAFPASDGALRRAFPEFSTKQIEQRAASWRPFRAYAAQHLWTALALEEL